MKRKTREKRGITLIALIITIVVLLILAVVAINAVTGDGIIQHASNAKTSYENAQAVENSIIGEYEAFLDKHNPNKKIITFTCYLYTHGNGVGDWSKVEKLQAEEGMTWYEWCKSDYNNLKFKCNGLNSTITEPSTEELGFCRLGKNDMNTEILGKEIIIEGYSYYMIVND